MAPGPRPELNALVVRRRRRRSELASTASRGTAPVSGRIVHEYDTSGISNEQKVQSEECGAFFGESVIKPFHAAARAVAPYLVAVSIACGAIPQAHADTKPAENFVQQSINKSFAILQDRNLWKQERQTEFRNLMRSVIDFKRIAVFALGPYAHQASGKDVDGFVNAFSDYLISMFHLDQNPSVGGDAVAVTGATEHAADDVIVSAKIAGSDAATQTGTPLNIGFRVRKDAAGHDVIVDILIGGVSVAVTQRDEFSSWLQEHRRQSCRSVCRTGAARRGRVTRRSTRLAARITGFPRRLHQKPSRR